MILRAPREHGQILAIPPLDQVGPLLERNRHILGETLVDLRALARREVLEASAQYHRQAGEPIADSASDLLVVAGHQPELFHPGVWYKNFAINQLARQHSATSLNLVIDTDSAKPALLHLPAGDRLARVPFDRSVMDTPYEERIVEEESTFADFPNRVAPIAAGWNFEPMLPTFWSEVMRQTTRTPLLGERFAAGRRALERRWGCVQREVPMSRVCQTESFARFACSILENLPAFHEAYNQVVRDYRRAHRIRSRNHPVPDLASAGEWLEAPFWIWRTRQPRRGKLFVRKTRDAWSLRIGNVEGPKLPCTDPVTMADAWRELESQGVKIRSRALTTTMFARLLLADLFVHGIGGGIYDELTDRIIERYFRVQAPAFLVLSATVLLPLPRFPDARANRQLRARELRDIRYKPERFLPREPEAAWASLVREKQDWIGRIGATHAERLERFERIRAINLQLSRFVQPLVHGVEAAQNALQQRMKADAIARRRDYAFCLYPEEMLRAFFAAVL